MRTERPNAWFCTQTTPGLERTTQVTHTAWLLTNHGCVALAERGRVCAPAYEHWIFAKLTPREQDEFFLLETPPFLPREEE